jgi:hypothetical protein
MATPVVTGPDSADRDDADGVSSYSTGGTMEIEG